MSRNRRALAFQVRLNEQEVRLLEQLALRRHADKSTVIRQLVVEEYARRGEMVETTGDSIMAKLGLSEDELNSMYTAVPTGGYDGREVARRLREQHGIDEDETLGDGLVRLGILTEDEGAWLDDD
jgi:nitrate reductase beta subunit